MVKVKNKKVLRLKSDMDEIRKKKIRLLKRRKINRFLFEFFTQLIVYGVLLNIAMATAFGYILEPPTIVGWGLVYYFARYEICGRVNKSWIQLIKS